MKNANIVLIEDLPLVRKVVRQSLASSCHTITREAPTLGEALSAIDEISAGKLVCDVVILDAELGWHPEDEKFYYPGYDAQMVVSRLSEHNLFPKLIGFSASSMEETFGISVDADLMKHVDGLETTIDSF